MKKLIYILSIICSITLFTSCDTTSDDPSKITYFVDMEMNGDEILMHAKSEPFIDPGCSAILNGENITDQIVTKGSVDVNKLGLYTISYSASNEDGISKSLTRKVYVYDATESILKSGVYTTDKTSYRLYGGATTAYGGYNIVIYQTSPGEFYITDFFGGWYEQRAGYGSNYAMTGHFKLNEDNIIELSDSHLIGWDDSIVKMENSTYDPDTGTISWDVTYASGMLFRVILKKQ